MLQGGYIKSPLTCNFTLFDVLMINVEGEHVPYTLQNGSYLIYPTNIADINWDYYVGIDDIFYAAQHFGSDPVYRPERWDPECDVNGDNYIGIDDIFIIASNFGWTPDP